MLETLPKNSKVYKHEKFLEESWIKIVETFFEKTLKLSHGQ